jgi:Tfp pilus assembly protein PilF
LLAQLFIAQKSLDKAILELQNAIAVNPNSGPTHVIIGVLYQTQNNIEKAKLHYSHALKIDPGLAVAANNYAWILCEDGGSLDEALKLAGGAKEKMPDSSNVMDTLAWIYYKRGAYQTAINLFTECIKKEPKNATFHYHIGMSYLKNGEESKAKGALTQALKLNPNLPEISEVNSILAKL